MKILRSFLIFFLFIGENKVMNYFRTRASQQYKQSGYILTV
jgi:hypothetical protein